MQLVVQCGFAANCRADGRVLPSAGRPGVWVACESPVFEDSPVGVAVGTAITNRPPHGPVLAALPHTVLTSDV